MSEIKIDKNVPIPFRIGQKYPFGKMEVGDSFFIACEDGKKHNVQSRMMIAARDYKRSKNNGASFSSRGVDGGVRCWRVE